MDKYLIEQIEFLDSVAVAMAVEIKGYEDLYEDKIVESFKKKLACCLEIKEGLEEIYDKYYD